MCRRACLLLSSLVLVTPGFALPKPRDAWYRIDLPHFVLFSNAETARALEIGEGLERFRALLGTIAEGATIESPRPTRVFVFQDSRSLGPYRRSSLVSGYFIATLGGNYVAIDASAEKTGPLRIICHEYVHEFLNENFPDTPLWLSEGLAEFYSTFHERGSTVEVGQPISAHLAILRRGRWIPLDRLFEVTHRSREYNVRDWKVDFYAESWVLTHYLIGADQVRRRHVGEFFQLLKPGANARDVLLASIGVDLPTLERAVKSYARQTSFPFYQLVLPSPLSSGRDLRVTPIDRAELLYRLGDLLVQTGPLRPDEVEEHLNAALALDPGRVDVYIPLGMLRQAEGRLDDAEKLFDRAVGEGSLDARAYRFSGRLKLERAVRLPKGEPDAVRSRSETLTRARELLRRSLELEPGDPRTQLMLGRACVGDLSVDGPTLEEGITVLREARARLATDAEVTYNLLALLARKGECTEARSLLEESIRPLKPDPALVTDAEHLVVAAEIRKAEGLVAEGKADDALRLVHASMEKTGPEDLKKSLAEMESRIRAAARPDQANSP